MPERSASVRTIKRRGILAAASAVLAGIAAKQAASPVAATDGNFVQIGHIGAAGDLNNEAQSPTGVLYTGGSLTGGPGANILTVSDGTDFSSSHPAALAGYSEGSGNIFTGVFGYTSGGNAGVYGKTASGFAGVYGNATNGYGVYGFSTGVTGVFGSGNGSGTFGVLGSGFSGSTETGAVGVQGQGAQYGVVGTTNNAPNAIAVWGNNTSTSAGAIGVRGDCTNGVGIYGTTAAAGQYGVLGQTLANNSFGLTGIANGSGCAAFAGATTNASSFAAYFQGHVQVDGVFDVIGAGNKHAVVPHPDGSHRTIYSIESPECWVEDFGKGVLTAGKAEIALDKDFAALIHTDEYHVFLTEHGGHNGLHTTAKTASGFTVAAAAHVAKAAGVDVSQVQGMFSWRVVAKPKTDANVERLAKATLAPKMDFTKLPKPPPAPPIAQTPPKKP